MGKKGLGQSLKVCGKDGQAGHWPGYEVALGNPGLLQGHQGCPCRLGPAGIKSHPGHTSVAGTGRGDSTNDQYMLKGSCGGWTGASR